MLPRAFNTPTGWIRCFAHVLNLGAQAAIDVLKRDPGRNADVELAGQDFTDGRDIDAAVLKRLSLYERVSFQTLLV